MLYFSSLHDRSAPVLSPEFRIVSLGSSVVASVLVLLAFLVVPGISVSPDLEVKSDASGFLGFGSYFNGEWFSGSWVSSQASHSIAHKELFPVVIGAHEWGSHFARHNSFALPTMRQRLHPHL